MKTKLALIVVIFLLLPTSVHAYNRSQVLGESTQAANLKFPDVSSGPGLILPDSPFFFLDEVFQNLKVSLARTPEDKAKARAEIIGERLAELRLMMQKNDDKIINDALENLTEESDKASEELIAQSAKGQDVSEAAKSLNEAIKQERNILDSLSQDADGFLELELKSARDRSKFHKAKVEDHLPGDLLEKEIEDEIQTEIEHDARDAEEATSKIQMSLLELQEQATEAAKKSNEKKLEAIKKAIELKNEELKKEAEIIAKVASKKLEAEKKQRELLIEKAKKAAEATKELKDQAETSKEVHDSSDDSDETESVSSESSKSEAKSSNSGSSGNSGSSSEKSDDDQDDDED